MSKRRKEKDAKKAMRFSQTGALDPTTPPSIWMMGYPLPLSVNPEKCQADISEVEEEEKTTITLTVRLGAPLSDDMAIEISQILEEAGHEIGELIEKNQEVKE